MRQYEIWWAELPAPAGVRPVLLLQRTAAYRYLPRVLVVEITSRIRLIPQELSLGEPEGLPAPSVASLDNIRRIARHRLRERAGQLAPGRLPELRNALGHTLAWRELLVA